MLKSWWTLNRFKYKRSAKLTDRCISYNSVSNLVHTYNHYAITEKHQESIEETSGEHSVTHTIFHPPKKWKKPKSKLRTPTTKTTTLEYAIAKSKNFTKVTHTRGCNSPCPLRHSGRPKRGVRGPSDGIWPVFTRNRKVAYTHAYYTHIIYFHLSGGAPPGSDAPRTFTRAAWTRGPHPWRGRSRWWGALSAS